MILFTEVCIFKGYPVLFDEALGISFESLHHQSIGVELRYHDYSIITVLLLTGWGNWLNLLPTIVVCHPHYSSFGDVRYLLCCYPSCSNLESVMITTY